MLFLSYAKLSNQLRKRYSRISFSDFITFSASLLDLFWVFKVLFCLMCFVWSLMKAFFSASPVSKPKYFPTSSQAFSSHIHYGMLGSLYHTNMDTFVLHLPVVLLMLITFFNSVFKKAFLQWVLFELQCKQINYFLFSEKLWYHAFIFECFCSFKFIGYPKVYDKISNIFNILRKAYNDVLSLALIDHKTKNYSQLVWTIEKILEILINLS